MRTDTPRMEKPTGSANYPAGHTDRQIVPATPDTGKAFSDLQVAYAVRGHTLYRITAPDGYTTDWAER